MAAKNPISSIDDLVQRNVQAEPAHVSATFVGTYYKNAEGGKGRESEHFTVTVKIPISMVANENFTPVAIFRQFYQEKSFQKLNGFNKSVQKVTLDHVEGELPPMSFEHELMWTTDRDRLLSHVKQHGKKAYTHYDLADDKPHKKMAEIKPELWPTVRDLRFALLRIQDEPEAFDREQAKRARVKDTGFTPEMQAEMAALMG